MVKYGDSGLWSSFRRQSSRHRQKRQPIDAVSVFFLRPSPLLVLLFLSMKRKSRTSCQPIALALGHSVLGGRKKSLWRSSIFPKMIMNTSARRGSLEGFSYVVIFVTKWSSTKNHRSLLDLSGVGAGKEQEKHSRYPKMVDWAAKKWIFWPQGKLSLVVVQSGTSEKKTNQK